ncbi:MAG: energy-coupling factor transporter transmembrane protein EcfT [Propionibacteriaceae bacterium]|nr:energy-coupling factor transporter transmembrane protein EcfT [Propionibacteriaceae bacterium]
MSAAAERVFGAYRPLGSVVEGWPTGLKYLVLLVLAGPACVLRQWPLTLAGLALGAGLLLAAGLGVRRGLGLPGGYWILLICVWLANGWSGRWLGGGVIVGNLVLALWASRLVVMTTPAPRLIDALTRAVRPLRVFGLRPERFGLAVMVMWRSLPYLIGCWEDVGQAVRARGLKGQAGPRATQLVVRAVAHAQATGQAMAARGLGDD